MTGERQLQQSSLCLAAGAIVLAGFGLQTGTISSLAAWVCMFSVPAIFVLAARRPGVTVQVIGLAHLGLIVGVALDAQGHDLRYTLAGVLLAISGLHAARSQTNRDRLVAVGIQLAILACALSQLDSGTHGVAIAWLACWLLTAAPQLRLTLTAPASPGMSGEPAQPLGMREARRISGSVALIVVVAAIAWLVLPRPPSRDPQNLNDGSSSSAQSGGSAAQPGAARVGLNDSDVMNLNLRGTGSMTPQLLVDGAPSLWRAEIFDRYDGKSWLRDAPSSQPLGAGSGVPVPIPLPDSSGDVSATTSITVHALADQTTLISAGQPLSVLSNHVVDFDDLGDLHSLTPAGESYTSVGGVPGPTAHAGAAPAEASEWLQLPSSLPERVRALARTWTAGATDASAQAADIDRELAAHETYDLASPVPASGEDAVDDMLFNSHSGFCEQFAAATAVMLRSLGVPARVVSGYADGSPTAIPGERLVTDADAHAWVEFWSPGRGWITNDPTAGVPLAPTAAVVHHRTWHRLLNALKRVPWWGWTLLGLAVVAVSLVVVWLRRRSARTRSALLAATLPTYPAVVEAFAELTAALAATGVPRAPTETPADLLLRVPGGWDRRATILPVLERQLWGAAPPDDAAIELAAAALRELAAAVHAAALEPA